MKTSVSDVGYDGISPEIGFINNILNRYFNEYFPRAVNLSEQLRTWEYVENFVYTTHPWLVSLYLDCPEHFRLSDIPLLVSIEIYYCATIGPSSEHKFE